MHGKHGSGRLNITGMLLALLTLAGCGQIGQKVVDDVARKITPDPNTTGQDILVRSKERRAADVQPGISVLLTDSIELIRGRRVGLLTNHTGIDERGVSDIERLQGDAAGAAGVRLVTLFSPEHGIRGTEDRVNLASGIDAKSGLVVHSLYTNTTIAPPDSTLRDLDVLVVDLQDIGTRTWTYVGSMLYAMRAAAAASDRGARPAESRGRRSCRRTVARSIIGESE
jgi:hypothetical protein